MVTPEGGKEKRINASVGNCKHGAKSEKNKKFLFPPLIADTPLGATTR
jgi:hypothetical protein